MPLHHYSFNFPHPLSPLLGLQITCNNRCALLRHPQIYIDIVPTHNAVPCKYLISVHKTTGVQVKMQCKPCGRLKGRNPFKQNGNVLLGSDVDEDLQKKWVKQKELLILLKVLLNKPT